MSRLLIAVVALLIGCEDPEAPSEFQAPRAPVCGQLPLGFHSPEELVVTGLASNALHKTEDSLWIVESRDNTIGKYDLNSGAYSTIADVGNDRNPYDLFVETGHIWVTNYLSNSVSIMDRQTGVLVRELESEAFQNPSGVAVLGGVALVTNVNYLSPSRGFGESTLVAFDTQTFEQIWARSMPNKNTQFADVFTWQGSDHVVVTSTGSVEFEDGRAVATSNGSVDIFGLEDPFNPTHKRIEFDVPTPSPGGALSRPAHIDGTSFLYFVSATSPEVYKLDAETMTWIRGRENPIRLYETTQDSLHHITAGADGILYVTAFNTDEIWRVDTRCDEVVPEPIHVGRTSLLEGPHMIQTFVAPDGGVDAYYLMSLSNVLGRVRFRAQPTEDSK